MLLPAGTLFLDLHGLHVREALAVLEQQLVGAPDTPAAAAAAGGGQQQQRQGSGGSKGSGAAAAATAATGGGGHKAKPPSGGSSGTAAAAVAGTTQGLCLPKGVRTLQLCVGQGNHTKVHGVGAASILLAIPPMYLTL